MTLNLSYINISITIDRHTHRRSHLCFIQVTILSTYTFKTNIFLNRFSIQANFINTMSKLF